MRLAKKVVHLVPTFHTSGRSVVVGDICTRLAARGFHCVIAVLAGRPEFAPPGVSVVTLHQRKGLDLASVAALASLLRRERAGILHTHGRQALFHGLLAARLGTVPRVVHTVHRADGDVWTHNRFLRAAAARCIHMVTAVSDAARHKFVAAYNFPEHRTVTIYNGVDLDRFQTGAASAPLEPELLRLRQRSSLIVGTVANFSPDKDYETLLAAFAEVVRVRPGAHLIAVGDGPLLPQVKAAAAQQGIAGHVTFLGWRADVPVLLRLFDVFVLSTRTEGLGIALLEAMAARVPVVGSAVGGVKEVIEDGVCGRLFRPQDAQMLKETIVLLEQDAALRAAWVAAAYERVRARFSLEAMCAAYEKVYLGNPPPCPAVLSGPGGAGEGP